jgi:DNA modification methylase
MNYKKIEISKLMPYENNARTHSEAQLNRIAESISEFGFINPILIDKEYGIIAGHGRMMAAKQLGIDKVPCLFVEHLSEEQKRAYIIADNKLALDAGWDYDILESEMKALQEMDFDLELTGFTEDEIAGIIKLGTEEEYEDDFDPEEALPEEAVTKPGDIWQLGEHILACGDSTNSEDMKRLVDDRVVDLIVTDPPYNVTYKGRTKKRREIENDHQPTDDFTAFLEATFKNMSEWLKPGGVFYIWHADRMRKAFIEAMEGANLSMREVLVWIKNRMVFGPQDYHWQHEPCLYGWKDGATHYFIDDRTQTTVMQYDKPAKSIEHPTMKPIELIAKQIQNSSRTNEVVLDPFGGSGTTLIACEHLKRKCLTMELDPRYCDVIVKRWEELTGQKAERLT